MVKRIRNSFIIDRGPCAVDESDVAGKSPDSHQLLWTNSSPLGGFENSEDGESSDSDVLFIGASAEAAPPSPCVAANNSPRSLAETRLKLSGDDEAMEPEKETIAVMNGKLPSLRRGGRKLGFDWSSSVDVDAGADGLASGRPPDRHLLLNVGGRSFRIRCSTIQYRAPTSVLGRFTRMSHADRVAFCDGFIDASGEYYFERAGRVFEPIYDFLTSGHFHNAGDICRERLSLELAFWKIGKDFFAPCCMNDEDNELEMLDGKSSQFSSVAYCDEFDGICCGALRRKLWRFTEDPGSSFPAKVFAMISIVMVLASVSSMIVGSLPEFQTNVTTVTLNRTSGKETTVVEAQPIAVFEYIEVVCILWFTVEYILRFSVCSEKLKFSRTPLNLIDISTIVPFYLELVLHYGGSEMSVHTIGEVKTLAMVMRVVRVMRVTRIFKLARYSSGLKSFGMTVRTSLPELSMLTLFLLTAIIFFATLIYFAERDEPDTTFRSIPDACWWAVVTMTTVGYGDYCPTTVFGKMIASCASISGVLVLAFPITMIVENFSKNYVEEKHDFKVVQRRRRMAKAYG
ncbi:hypothetical protein QR680_013294 [Steinernema hermaphroditum]|uniref:BTB domain-containing protein n=1 Tax=Steinernema hermaphroditum TaxID=289476 RepID=A0AA39M293_9BILA|nr:hypothetical protein QR680_013294 [Steinernema hermaphroditum]